MLALSAQTRKAQTREKESNIFDEDFIIDKGNLGKTAQSNKRKARKDINRKLKNLEDSEIIDGFSVGGKKQKNYIIKGRSQKKTS